MILTESRLKQIIAEEIDNLLSEEQLDKVLKQKIQQLSDSAKKEVLNLIRRGKKTAAIALVASLTTGGGFLASKLSSDEGVPRDRGTIGMKAGGGEPGGERYRPELKKTTPKKQKSSVVSNPKAVAAVQRAWSSTEFVSHVVPLKPIQIVVNKDTYVSKEDPNENRPFTRLLSLALKAADDETKKLIAAGRLEASTEDGKQKIKNLFSKHMEMIENRFNRSGDDFMLAKMELAKNKSAQEAYKSLKSGDYAIKLKENK